MGVALTTGSRDVTLSATVARGYWQIPQDIPATLIAYWRSVVDDPKASRRAKTTASKLFIYANRQNLETVEMLRKLREQDELAERMERIEGLLSRDRDTYA